MREAARRRTTGRRGFNGESIIKKDDRQPSFVNNNGIIDEDILLNYIQILCKRAREPRYDDWRISRDSRKVSFNQNAQLQFHEVLEV